ncbi:MAG: SH3 domain-containing protein [Oscillospiraceae bacterium]|jgi:SH3-like domain-containing protein|nr:SH3 domain-containing protein [Oscillospiraceae bacterium]
MKNNNSRPVIIALSVLLLFCIASPRRAAASEAKGAAGGILPAWLTQDAAEEDDAPRYGKTNIKGVNIRKKPDQKAAITVKVPISGTVIEITGEQNDKNGVKWLEAAIGGKAGFVRADLIDEMTDEENARYIDQLEQAAQAKSRQARLHASNASPTAAAQTQSGAPYPPGMTAYISSDGVYHSDPNCGCGSMESLWTTTLASAQAQGYTPCGYCWCLDCLYPEGF